MRLKKNVDVQNRGNPRNMPKVHMQTWKVFCMIRSKTTELMVEKCQKVTLELLLNQSSKNHFQKWKKISKEAKDGYIVFCIEKMLNLESTRVKKTSGEDNADDTIKASKVTL